MISHWGKGSGSSSPKTATLAKLSFGNIKKSGLLGLVARLKEAGLSGIFGFAQAPSTYCLPMLSPRSQSFKRAEFDIS